MSCKCKERPIVLIIPATISHRTPEENLGVNYIAAVLREKKYQVLLIDSWLTGLGDNEVLGVVSIVKDPLWIGISSYHYNINESKELLDRLKNIFPNSKYICGGYGPTFQYKDYLESGFDIAVIGEAEKTVVELTDALSNDCVSYKDIKGICYLDNGEIVRTDQRKRDYHLDDLPFPARDLLDTSIKRCNPIHLLTSRGCYGNCDFCSINSFYGLSSKVKWSPRSLNNILSEISTLSSKGCKFIKIIDDSFIEPPRGEKWCEHFLRYIRKHDIRISFRASVRADRVTYRIIELLKECGFYSYSCGIENFSNIALKRMNKTASYQDNKKALDIFSTLGIFIQAGHILFDSNTTIDELWENYIGMEKYNWIISKGIFSEMFPAKGTTYTNKIIRQESYIIAKSNDNIIQNKIVNDDVRRIYNALKYWQKSISLTWDKIVDPISAPKALSQKHYNEFYRLHMQIKSVGLDFFKELLELDMSGWGDVGINEYVEFHFAKNEILYRHFSHCCHELYSESGLVYSGSLNPYIMIDK